MMVNKAIGEVIESLRKIKKDYVGKLNPHLIYAPNLMFTISYGIEHALQKLKEAKEAKTCAMRTYNLKAASKYLSKFVKKAPSIFAAIKGLEGEGAEETKALLISPILCNVER